MEGYVETWTLYHLWRFETRLPMCYPNSHRCRFDWRERQITDIRHGVFYPTRFASPQGALIPLDPQESLVVHRPQVLRRQPRRSCPTQQLVLFESTHTG
jgi:hypothetical protein